MDWSFRLQNLIITVLIFLIIWLFSIIPYKLIFLDPLAKAVGDFELNDIVFSKLYPEQHIDTNIVLVNIGNLNRLQIARQIKIINSFNPKVVGVDAIFDRKINKFADSVLASVFNKTENLVLVGILQEYSESGNYYKKYIKPNKLFTADAIWGYANLPTKFGASSKTIREFRPFSNVNNGRVPAFSVRVIEAFDMNIYQNFLERRNDLEIINYRGNIDKFITLDTDIFQNNKQSLDFLTGKIVLLGFLGNSLTEKTLEDIYFTPLNETFAGRSYPDMYGVVIHANIISMVLNEKYIDSIPSWVSAILAFIFCYINVAYLRKIKRKLIDYYGGISKLLIFIQTTIILIINISVFLILQYKMSFTLMLVGLIFVPSTVILFDNLLKHLGYSIYYKIKGMLK